MVEDILQQIDIHVTGWPEYDGQPVDLENFEVEPIVIVAGGDWQPAHRIKIDPDSMEVISVEILEDAR